MLNRINETTLLSQRGVPVYIHDFRTFYKVREDRNMSFYKCKTSGCTGCISRNSLEPDGDKLTTGHIE